MDSALQPTSFMLQIKRRRSGTRHCPDFIPLGLNYSPSGGGGGIRGGDLRQSPAGVEKTKQSDDGLMSGQCLMCPQGRALDPLELIKPRIPQRFFFLTLKVWIASG